MSNDRVKFMTAEDLSWPFDDSVTRPQYSQPARFTWTGSVRVDPFACYPHDRALVEECVEKIERLFPIGCLPMYYILSHETEARTNGWCECAGIYQDEDKAKARSPFEPKITLAGKRIPIHPAWTRYLVPHEYGHAVQRWCEHKLGLYDDRNDGDKFLKQYAEIRGCEYNKRYGGGRWHTNIGEIFANDFRIIIGGAEAEFWPHPVEHPLKHSKIMTYWLETLSPLSFQEPKQNAA